MSIKILQLRIQKLPHKPGVYVFHDADGVVIYVGKAKDLRKRVSSYFQKTLSLAPDKRLMVQLIDRVEVTIVGSETEAFLLEASLIKKYRPRFNIILKDDKNFSYIKVTLSETFPRVLVVRNIVNDGSRYFGPFLSTGAVYETLSVLRQVFHYRTCDRLPKKPCLEYHMGRCTAPCSLAEAKSGYADMMAGVLHFLKGDVKPVLEDLEKKMRAASHARAFEKAAKYRDQIRAVKRIVEKQHVISVKRENQDVVSVVKIDGVAGVNIFSVRGGKLLGKANFILQHTEHAFEHDILEAFLQQYYTQVVDFPAEIIVPYPVALPGIDAVITVPERGHKRALLEMGITNARDHVEVSRASWERDEHRVARGLRELAVALDLSAPPSRVEVYDISNIQGYQAVGSMIVFIDGRPRKDAYRKFAIRSLKTPNDFAMLQEILWRRFQHAQWGMPDLVIIDGGKGQLNAVKKVFDALKISVPLASLAKREEELFIPTKKDSIRLPVDSQGMYLVQRMRDEAHRFAIGFYRDKHTKAFVQSRFDEISGLGAVSKKKLLRQFGSLAGVRAATDEELRAVVGGKMVRLLRQFL